MNPQLYDVFNATMMLETKIIMKNYYKANVADWETVYETVAKDLHDAEKEREKFLRSGAPSNPILDLSLQPQEESVSFIREKLEENKEYLTKAEKEVANARTLLARCREQAAKNEEKK